MDVKYDFDKICRTCLKQYNIELESLFEITTAETLSFLLLKNNDDYDDSNTNIIATAAAADAINKKSYEIIMACATIQISKNDGMPENICTNCLQKLHIAYAFKKTCEESDLKLREYVKIQIPNFLPSIKKENNHLIDDISIDIKPELIIQDLDPLNEPIFDVNEHFDLDHFNDDDGGGGGGGGGGCGAGIISDNCDDPKDLDFVCGTGGKTRSRRNAIKSYKYDDDDDDYIVSVTDTTKSTAIITNTTTAYDDDDAIDGNYKKNIKKKKNVDVDYKYNASENDENKNMDDDEELLVEKAKRVNGRFNCQFCEKTLCDRRTLKLHIRLHTGNNLKRCTICNRGFSKKNHLTRHMESHKKDHNCNCCSEKFNSFHEKRMHMNSVHSSGSSAKKRGRPSRSKALKFDTFYKLGHSNGEKKCICKICNKTFHKISELRYHVTKIHSETTSFNGINLKEKPEIFTFPNINAFSDDILIDVVKTKIENNENIHFYQIVNSHGWEMSLSDSETDFSDTDDYDYQKITNDFKFIKRDQYKCEQCTKIFDRIYKIVYHMRFEHEHQQHLFVHKCLHCNNVFPTDSILQKHLREQCQNSVKKIQCQICKIRFMWHDSLEEHTRKMHGTKTNDGGGVGGNNGKVSTSTSNKKVSKLKIKIKDETPKEKTFFCDLCAKSFFRLEHLERHRKVHMPAEKRFSCDLCKKKFNRKDNLKSHMRVHLGDKEKEDGDKHLCVYCGRSFSNSSNLIVHMRRHTGEKPYKCDFCDKGFPRSSDLQCHRRTHTGEKPCLCTICGKGFSRSNKLVRHMRIHTGVRPYKCTYCERAFTQSNDLTLHIRRHTGDKPYVCGVCGDRFIQGTALQTHRRMQGHFEEGSQQPLPYSSISVNNPNRFTNANRVNRIGLLPSAPTIKQEIKPVINHHQNFLLQQQQQQQQLQQQQQQQLQLQLQHHHHLQQSIAGLPTTSLSLLNPSILQNLSSSATTTATPTTTSAPSLSSSTSSSAPLSTIPINSSTIGGASAATSTATTTSSSSSLSSTSSSSSSSSSSASILTTPQQSLRNIPNFPPGVPYGVPAGVPFLSIPNLEVPAYFSITHNYNPSFN